MSLSLNLRQNPRITDYFAHSKQVIGGACTHPSPTPFAPSSPGSLQFQGSSAVREARICRGVSATRGYSLHAQSPREAQLAPPQVAQVPKGRIAVSVNPVPLYTGPAQVLPQHQLPPANFQVSNDIFSCIPVRSTPATWYFREAELAAPQVLPESEHTAPKTASLGPQEKNARFCCPHWINHLACSMPARIVAAQLLIMLPQSIPGGGPWRTSNAFAT